MFEPVLYILMRNDLASLNPGKACAQAGHAANQFAHKVANSDNESAKRAFDEWASQVPGCGFGITIVLEASGTTIYEKVCAAQKFGLVADMVIDPTYPVRDGDVTHLINIRTCGYIFIGEDTDPSNITDDLPLMR